LIFLLPLYGSKAIPLLRKLMSTDDPQQPGDPDDLKGPAVGALAEFGKASDGLLYEAMKSGRNSEVQITAIRELSYTDRADDVPTQVNHEAVPAIIQALGDQDPKVREAAADALGLIRDSRALSPLVNALHDKDPEVAYEAAKALGDIGDAHAIAGLDAALHGTTYGSTDPDVHGVEADAIAKIKG
jgi:HEAT repeat protein